MISKFIQDPRHLELLMDPKSKWVDAILHVLRQFDPQASSMYLANLLEALASKRLFHAYDRLLQYLLSTGNCDYEVVAKLLSHLEYFKTKQVQRAHLLCRIFTERVVTFPAATDKHTSIYDVLKLFVK